MKNILAYVLDLIPLHNLNLRSKGNYYRYSQIKNKKISHQTFSNDIYYLLLANDPRTIKLSSIRLMISDVLSPRRRSLPRFLNAANVSSWVFHSVMTPFNFA